MLHSGRTRTTLGLTLVLLSLAASAEEQAEVAPAAPAAPAAPEEGAVAAPASGAARPGTAAGSGGLAAPTDSATETLSKDVEELKSRLPFRFSAGAYAFVYSSLSPSAFTPSDLTPQFDIYVLYATFDKKVGPISGHAELRFRDGGHRFPGANNDFLRPQFSSNLWFQELYASVQPQADWQVKLGKVYRRFGLFWDDSFFGNVHYYDGHKLNPDYGASLEGKRALPGAGRLSLSYTAQYFLQSDGINGSINYAREVGPGPGQEGFDPLTRFGSPEAEQDSGGNRMTQLRHVGVGRLALVVAPAEAGGLGLDVGVSGLNGRVRRASALDGVRSDRRFSQAGVDATLTYGPGVLALEYTEQFGPGLRDASYLLGSVRYQLGSLQLRFGASHATYRVGGQPVQEFQLVPGLTYAFGGGLSAMLEYDEFQRFDPRLGGSWSLWDRSLTAVLVYGF
jgi:hypothetical protein